MTARAIDHVVIAVTDLDAAARDYEALGFTLTPRAAHDDRMGTCNRLAQFARRDFIELLELDRPQGIAQHDREAVPPRFGFGAQIRDFLRRREGMAMLVLASEDARADLAAFERAGIDTYAPFDFERQATLPDGTSATLGFSLAFATSPLMPDIAFFTCQNKAPQHFWKPPFQRHANGALGIAAVYVVAPEPAPVAAFLKKLVHSSAIEGEGGFTLPCGKGQKILVLTPEALAARVGDMLPERSSDVLFAGLALYTSEVQPSPPEIVGGHGLFIEWRQSVA